MSLRLPILASVLLAACHPIEDKSLLPPPRAYVHFNDRLAAQMLLWGIRWRMPCAHEHKDDECFKFSKPERVQGLWRNNFEASQFCATPAVQCRPEDHATFVWLEFASPVAGRDETPPGGLYAIDFVGRHSEYGGLFGGQAGANKEAIVDRMISIKLVEPPPAGQMTREHVQAYLKECAGKQICMPNSEVRTMK